MMAASPKAPRLPSLGAFHTVAYAADRLKVLL